VQTHPSSEVEEGEAVHLVITVKNLLSDARLSDGPCKRWFSTSHGGCAACPFNF
jgi:hypothetical protein